MATDILWFSPTDYVTGDSSLKISYPSVTHPAVEVTTSASGDYKWVYLALNLTQAHLHAVHEIVAVHVCYQLSHNGSLISQIRLLEMRTPEHAVVCHDDGIDQISTDPTCCRSQLVRAYRPNGAIFLALRLSFSDANDKITLGAVGVEVNQILTWNAMFQRPEIRGPISFSPGKPLRADTGFVHYGGNGLHTDFHNKPFTHDPWDADRSVEAAWRILSNIAYPPYRIDEYNGRFLPYNPYGTYAVQLAISRTMNADPALQTRLAVWLCRGHVS